MKSNYKRIGDYIQLIDERNKGFGLTDLLGLTINKEFIPSVANTIGSDMANYKVIRKGQFACSLMQVRRDKKIPVAMLKDFDEAIISQAYPVFEITDTENLLPEYLMMWMSRSEFDREACFYAVGGVRGSLEWEDFCNMELPVPSIEKQREIAKEYNTIVNRIKLNEQLNKKLEETAQAIYKQWFVDFEFPDKNGNPYKSSGGEMVWNDELEQEIPANWSLSSIKKYCSDTRSGGTPSRTVEEYWRPEEIPWIKTGEVANCVIVDSEEYISSVGLKNSSAKLLPINSVLMAMYGDGKTKGQVAFLRFQATTNQACCAMICSDEAYASYLYYYLFVSYKEIVNQANGGAQENLSKKLIEELPIIIPPKYIFSLLPFMKFINVQEVQTREVKSLQKLRELILQKMTKVSV